MLDIITRHLINIFTMIKTKALFQSSDLPGKDETGNVLSKEEDIL